VIRFKSIRPLFFLFLFIQAACGRGDRPVGGSYAIGRDETWFPLTLGEKTANVNGFTNALVQEISQETGQPMYIQNLSWDQLFSKLDRHELSGVFTSISPNVENQKKYTFSDPFLLLGPVLVVQQNSQKSSLAQMGVSKIGVSQYDDSILILQKYPSIQIELYENMPTALDDLAEDKIDGVLISNIEAHTLVPTRYLGKLRIATKPLSNKGLRLITIKEKNDPLIKYFNDGLRRLQSNSRYPALIEKFNVY
jgi:polar amino acid transport system substrate-binding protein